MSKIIEVESISMADAKKEYLILWDRIKHYLPLLREPQIAIVVAITTNTCHYCYESNVKCQCSNDE